MKIEIPVIKFGYEDPSPQLQQKATDLPETTPAPRTPETTVAPQTPEVRQAAKNHSGATLLKQISTSKIDIT